MPDLFSPYTLKGVTLRNRIAMSPMTMYRSTDGLMNDYHVMHLVSWNLGLPEYADHARPTGVGEPALAGLGGP